MRRCVPLLCAVLALSGVRLSTAQESEAHWNLIKRFPSGNEIYVDLHPGRFQQYVTIRVLKSVAGGGSFVTDVALDCKKQTATTLRLVHYDGRMGDGNAKELATRVNDSTLDGLLPWDKFVFPPEIEFPKLARQACPPLAPGEFSDAELKALDALLAPYVRQARETYREAKRRFLAGLPEGQSFAVTMRAVDQRGRVEQLYLKVNAIDSGKISGQIASPVQVLEGYTESQQYSVQEADILDWTIFGPGGVVLEGNVVGKYIASIQNTGR